MSEQEFNADRFWVMANDRIDTLDKEEEVRNRDVTLIFYNELDTRIKKGELINININGNVRLGKSTLGMHIISWGKKRIEKHWNVTRPMSNKNVFRDQNEYSRGVKRRPTSFKHEFDLIDEWAEMELTGYNATIESKYLKQFSDVQAGRYYHRVACSPTNVTDENADILLSVVPGGREKGRTVCLLYYRMNRGHSVEPILLGHVIIDVTETLQAPWYQEYLKLKEEKWTLMNEHNVQSPRQLEYARIILNTYEQIRDGAKIGLTGRKHIKTFLQAEADEVGVWFSILGDKDILETLEGLAEREHLLFKYETELLNPKLKTEKRIALEKITSTIKEQMEKTLKRQRQLVKLWEAYQIL